MNYIPHVRIIPGMESGMSIQQLNDVLLPARKVWERYGVCDRTLNRWVQCEKLGFPAPILIKNRRYWYEGQLAAWERSRASGKAEAA